MPETRLSTRTSRPRAKRTIVPSRGSRTARSSREISVGCRPVFAASCSCDRPAFVRSALRLAAKRSSALMRPIVVELGQ
jgi:hypothetical protein